MSKSTLHRLAHQRAHGAARRLAEQTIRQRHPDLDDADVDELVEDLLANWLDEDSRERAERGVEDSPCIETCDDAGTGEGRFHGRI